ncbi:MAG: hypothetical protein M2R45_01291 [Verrucomicrobia subdivision 3 bacterium]|nr:hypothetical protein [Limisphaerales bacterium]MCS1415157.1 hypothetical protein [Limisphaerales bacterium]
MRLALLFAIIIHLTSPQPLAAERFAEVQWFRSTDAYQGIAVGSKFVYVIGSRTVSVHDKLTGTLINQWLPEQPGEIIHLDSRVVKDGKLYSGHSNYPMLPMRGSVEIFDAHVFTWLERHAFDSPPGSCIWVDWHQGSWWACFAHYNGFGDYPNKDNSWTTLVNWQEQQRWRFPKAVLERFGRYSCSGGSRGCDGFPLLHGA